MVFNFNNNNNINDRDDNESHIGVNISIYLYTKKVEENLFLVSLKYMDFVFALHFFFVKIFLIIMLTSF